MFTAGEKYEITEAFGWWIEDSTERPGWIGVMGSLHEDTRLLKFDRLHYHIDPRFLSRERQTWATQVRNAAADHWHPAYRWVMTRFPVPGQPALFFEVTTSSTIIRDRGNAGAQIASETSEWGLGRIRTRRQIRICKRRLPEARLDTGEAAGLHRIRRGRIPDFPERCSV